MVDVVDLEGFLKDKASPISLEECKKLASILKKTSCVIIKDPRVSENDNNNFLSMMERYYERPLEQKMKDVHPELSFALGATPEYTEIPRDHSQYIASLKPENAAHLPKGPDPKWRYFWNIGERPKTSKFPVLLHPPLIPENFPEWKETVEKWGYQMLNCIRSVAEMLAIGLGLPPQSFLNLMEEGPHSLAPTGSDLGKHNKEDTILAGFHYDLNLLTIHGKSRFPGLFIWLRDGTKIPVKVPDGCLFVQAGKQLEWLTGGLITAGFHEVVVTEDTLKAVEKAKQENRSLWRVSSTFFAHVALDKVLVPFEPFATETALETYPSILAGDQVYGELKMINLARKE